MSISYSISETINYEEVGLGTEDPTLVFPALYGNFDFGYTVTFSNTLGAITNVVVISSPLYTDTSVISTNSIQIQKNSNELFPNESYEFAFFDSEFEKTTEVYTPGNANEAGQEASIFKWNTPTQETVSGEYTFEITFINSSTLLEEVITKTYTQDLQWSQFPGALVLQNLVQESKY
jgi:hypothetical protein